MIKLAIGPKFLQYIIVIIANFTLLHMGLSIAWLSPMLVLLRNENQTILHQPLTEDEGAWIISISDIVGLFAMPFTGYLVNHLGRKYTMLLGCIPRIIMCFLFLFASEIWMMLLGRCFCGVSDLIILSATATYASEIASKEIRGGLGTLAQILSAIGATIMLSIGPFVSYVTMHLINTFIVCVTSLIMLFLPETPYFYYSKGKINQSIELLTHLRGSEMLAFEEIKDYSKTQDIKFDIKELFGDKVLLKTLGKAIAIAIFAQMVGYNAISFNLQTIFELTHTTVRPEISSVIIGCIQLFACFCTIFLVKRFGRKPLLMISLGGLALGQLGLGTFFKLVENHYKITGFLNYLPLISIILVIFCYNAGLGSLFLMQIAELFTGRFRAIGVSVAVFTTFVFAFLTLRYFTYVTHAIGPSTTYWSFCVFAILANLFICFAIPETEGKAYSEIQRDLGRTNIADKTDDS